MRADSGVGWFCWLGCILGTCSVSAQTGMYKTVSTERASPKGATPFEARQAMHRGGGVAEHVSAHLPNPKTASADALEVAGDVLRARRYPQDALDYYTDALMRGGNEPRLLNKLGVTELESAQARIWPGLIFKLAMKRDKKDAEAWNNLGATEYMDGQDGLGGGRLSQGAQAGAGVGGVPWEPCDGTFVEQKDVRGGKEGAGEGDTISTRSLAHASRIARRGNLGTGSWHRRIGHARSASRWRGCTHRKGKIDLR